jgi:hypothetical protein
MEPAELARSLSSEGRILEVKSGVSPLYRIWDLDETRLVKVYTSGAGHKRENKALNALSGMTGLPVVLDSGVIDERHYTVFADPGKWTLETLRESPGLGSDAGEILAELHSRPSQDFSNVAHGMDQGWLDADVPSVIRRLGRYRGKLQISAALLEKAATVPAPVASGQAIIHTNPGLDHFLVEDGGVVTLLHWEWATLGPPEWDYSRLLWLARARGGRDLASRVAAGYGSVLSDEEFKRWAVYHSGMMLIQSVEQADPQLRGLQWLISEFRQAVDAAAA